LNIANKNVRTPNNAAALNGHVEIFLILLDYGAGVNNADDERCKPLYRATSNGHVKAVLELLNHDASLNTTNKENFTTQQVGAGTSKC